MLSSFWPKLLAASLALILSVAIVEAWRADRRDRAQLSTELAATKKLLTAADARQRDRDAQLAQTLSALEAQKRAIVTPAQILRELQKSIPLPVPLTLQPEHPVGARFSASPSIAPGPTGTAQAGSGNTGQLQRPFSARTNGDKPAPGGAFLPRADLKPLYDFTLDCQACQAKLSVTQNDLADEKSKTVALTKERDDAIRLAKGGTAWHHVTRAAKWFLLGAAAGAVIAKAR